MTTSDVLLGTDPGVPDPPPTCTCQHIIEDHTDCQDAETCWCGGGSMHCDRPGCPCAAFLEAAPYDPVQSRYDAEEWSAK